MASSESYGVKLRAMRANLEVDRRMLEEMTRTGAKRDMLGRDRATLLQEIQQQQRRIRIGEAY